MFELAQGVEVKKRAGFQKRVKLARVINTYCCSICSELNARIQVLTCTQAAPSLFVSPDVMEASSDTPVDDIDARVVISAHGTSFLLIQAERLCPLSRKHCSDARMAASKMRLSGAIIVCTTIT